MKPTIHLQAGLPRSGSALLANIMAQNPECHVSPTSGILDVMFSVRNNWSNIVEFRANPDQGARGRVLRGILESYYSNVEKPVVVDRCRSWLNHLEMAAEVLGRRPKVLVPVRDVRDVLASLEKIHRATSAVGQSPHEVNRYLGFQTVADRVGFWSQKDQLVGLAWMRIRDAVDRGWRDSMHFVEYQELTSSPGATMKGIYDFLEMKQFKHDFNNVQQLIQENDDAYGFVGLHTIKSKVVAQAPQWPTILGEKICERFKDDNFWEKL